MATHPHIDRICAGALAVCLLLTVLLFHGEALGLQPASRAMGYEARLFDSSRVHTVDIVMDGWEEFLETCENEEYAPCTVVIDGEACRNVGLRAKGNTSLRTVASMDSDRYSFKIEFDQYEAGKSYYGLDKLCLNNIIQDNTYMKDYLAYQLMGEFGVAAPLCSYVFVTVNGEDWGLYLAVEGVEEGFLQRNYGSQYGQLYKPDSTSMGGGRGNGQGFDLEQFMDGREPGDRDPVDRPGGQEREPGLGKDMGLGADDVKLQYVDDDPASYPNIFDSAKTDATAADQDRLIQALKTLREGGTDALDVDQVLRYFVVHNFVVNGDSYTGDMVHNYYLYEKDGLLSMIPWDYNLAFGTFRTGDASSAVNDPIDAPLSVTGSGDRPMIDWIFRSEEYTQLYHQYFAQFLDGLDLEGKIDETYALIAPYVERDPTKFCTNEEFRTGVEALKDFCRLRVESISGQLAGTVPSTGAGQSASPDSLVDAGDLDLSDMGTMEAGGGHGGFPGGESPGGGFPDGEFPGRPEGGFPGGEMPQRPQGGPDGAL